MVDGTGAKHRAGRLVTKAYDGAILVKQATPR